MHFLKSGGCFSPWIFGYLDPWLRMQVEMVAPRRCLFLSGSVDLWIHCYQQRICYLTICDLTICNLTALTLPLLPCCYYLTLVAPRRCLIFEQIYGYMDPLLLTAGPSPYHLQSYHAFSKIWCVIFSMDFQIFGFLTTNACWVGGTQEVYIFEQICGSVDSLLSTEDLIPYHL